MKNIQFVNDECIEVYYTHREGFVSGANETTVVIAAFTTAHARLKLYSVLRRLQTRFLYFKTDSVIFTSESTDWMPVLGDYLGELANELDDDDYITTFVSGSPKNYAYQTKNGKTTGKVRGFTLNFNHVYVCNPNQQPIFLENPHFIKQDAKKNKNNTHCQLKEKTQIFKLVYCKRVVHGSTKLPYGYR